MRVQIDRFEDGGWAVFLSYSDGEKSFDVPREFLPEDASPGDVFDMKFERNEEETKKAASENKQLMDELLGRDER